MIDEKKNDRIDEKKDDLIDEELDLIFDEKDSVWIKVYKFLVIASAFIILIGGLYWAWFIAEGFLAVVFIVLAFFELVSGMLVINFLNNVQIIREKLEEK